MNGPRLIPLDEEDYDEDPDEDLVTDQWEDPDLVDDENDDPRGDEQP